MDEINTIANIKKTTLNLVGYIFGELTVVDFSHYNGRCTFWNCRCSCGNEITVNQIDLFSLETNNCGCKKQQININLDKNLPKPCKKNKSGITGVFWDKKDKTWKVAITYRKATYSIGAYQDFQHAINARINAEKIVACMKKEDLKNSYPYKLNKKPNQDLIGQKFGKLTVVSLVKYDKYIVWHCKCECGKEKDVYQHNLTNNKTISCGCEKKKIAKEQSKKNLHVYKGIQIEKSMAKTTPKNNTSGFRGVIHDKKSGKYRVRIILQGVRHELGWYSDFEEAKKARLVAEEKRDAIVEEFLHLNSN